MDLQRLYSYTRQAIQDYDMIQEGDKIAIGISGGKDSLTLLSALAGLRRFYTKKFEIVAIHIDLGFEGVDLSNIQQFCNDLDVSLIIEHTQINQIIFEERKESNPCALCASMRRGAINKIAYEQKCTKLAYAHHKDDYIETMLLSLLYEGRVHSFLPVMDLPDLNMRLIRPLFYVPEYKIIAFSNKQKLPVFKNPCQADGNTKREYVKQLLKQLVYENPGCKERMFHAITKLQIEGYNQ